jgi:formamidopyrimidine-DNA glycosylase
MPELPEVETIRRTLDPLVRGHRIASVEARRRDLRWPLPIEFEASLVGRRVDSTSRRGKYLLFALDDGLVWAVHLGMSGTLIHHKSDTLDQVAKHEHVVVRLDDGNSLAFRDPRRFGSMLVALPGDCPFLSALGPEPLDRRAFTGDYLVLCRERTRRRVKDVLMDQRVVAGLGNIYVNEILFVAGIRPSRRMPRVSKADCETLVEATRYVLEDAIAHRGTSISDFLDGIGRPGGYQGRRRVYDRAREPCPRCEGVIRECVIGQRATFFCSSCQR